MSTFQCVLEQLIGNNSLGWVSCCSIIADTVTDDHTEDNWGGVGVEPISLGV